MASDGRPERVDPHEVRRRLASWPPDVSQAAIGLMELLLEEREELDPAQLSALADNLSQDEVYADQPAFQALFETLRSAPSDAQSAPTPALRIGWVSCPVRTAEWTIPHGLDLLLIDGDLEVEGVWSDAGDSERAAVVVRGSLSAGHLLNSGHLLVGGDLLGHVLMSNSGNDAYLWVRGDCLATALVLENGQYMRCGGALRAPLVVSVRNRIDAGSGVQGQFFDHQPELGFRALFLPVYRSEREVTEWDGQAWQVKATVPCVDFEAVWRDLALGRRVLAEGSAE